MRGGREFKLSKIFIESAVISTFQFEPTDGKCLSGFVVGQYIRAVFENYRGIKVVRDLMLSKVLRNNNIQVTVKLDPNDFVSNILHNNIELGDKVTLAAAYIERRLNKHAISLVVGDLEVSVTPATCMLNSAESSGRDIFFVHTSKTDIVHIFKKTVNSFASLYAHIYPLYMLDLDKEKSSLHAEFNNSEAIIGKRLVRAYPKVDFYLLGSMEFMMKAHKIARELGILERYIHYEYFEQKEE